MVVPRIISIEIIGEESSRFSDKVYYHTKSIYSDGAAYRTKTAIPSDILLDVIHRYKPTVIDSRSYSWWIINKILNYNLAPLPKEFFAYNDKIEFTNNDNV